MSVENRIRWEARADGTRFAACWSSKHGHLNVALYPPGVEALAMEGCPVFPKHWCAVFWFPGVQTYWRVSTEEADVLAIVAKEVTR